ncbi:hypothetical protein K461DRAFT_267806 [Myriangium duriaei CBS 260.36]|uniref:Membrane insertase YidC/Oxa/ALB C-terminal domain-containing protein n=1 Tax=Myriangium duriaei CBS 260.36 TaxID=1168546 RepID=A0A9P4MKI5_9PEZI|nr:hypothetical protein K461DRAFT_267806 [Myriangium duriaei CBS 260.36]
MMPSRGIQLGGRAVKASQFQLRYGSRNFSSGPSRPLVLNLARQSKAFTLSQEQRRNISWNPVNWVSSGHAPVQPAAAREAYTPVDPTPAAAAATPVAPLPVQETHTPTETQAQAVTTSNSESPVAADVSASSPIDVNLDTVSVFEPAAQEHIGYLHSLGLDYGWGPTSMVQWALEHIHVYSGMPWWGSLMATSVLIRVCIIPLTIKMSDNQARMSAIKPMLDPLQKQMQVALKNNDQLGMQKARQEMNIIRARSGFKFKWMGFAVVGNMVFAYCSFKLLRAMAALPVPGFLDGGAFWFQNLTLADPYYIIPGVMALGFHVATRLGTETGVDPYAAQPGMRTVMLYVLPAVICVSMAWFSAALTLWMATGGLVSIMVGRVLQNPEMRERMGLFPMPTKNPEQMNTIANFFREEATEAAPRVIDVQGTRSTSGSSSSNNSTGRMHYQAPRVNNTKAHNDVATHFAETANFEAPTAAAVARAAPSPLQEPKKGLLERYVNWGSARINDLGESYSLIGRKATGLIKKAQGIAGQKSDDDLPESKTKSKEYLRQAREYERRYEEEKRRGWR